MKYAILYIIIFLNVVDLSSQAPFAFNYQGVARDEFGSALFQQNISLFIEIVRGSDEGNVEYGEIHNVRTNDRGLFTLRIGEGENLVGNLRNIDWGIDRYYIRTEIDIAGGDEFVPLGSSQLYSVPYALYARNAGNANGGGEDNDSDPANELQTLNLNGQTLSISDGNSIELPSSGGSGGDSYWQSDGPFSIYYDGAVGINLGESRLITLEENSSNAGSVELIGTNQSRNVLLTSTAANADNGGVAILDDADDFKWISTTNGDGSGESWFVGENGESNVFISSLSSDPNRGFIGVYDSQGDISSRMYVGSSGQGIMSTSGSNGNLNTLMTWLSGSNNNGYISVHDSQGNEEAGVYVDRNGRGVVFGDIKNFKVNHPTKKDYNIVYASIEGPEAGAYVRGTASLTQGTTHVQFPEHFQHIISGPESMTVMITPLSADSKGIAVIKKTKTGFVVQELLAGEGNYKFDWEVKAVRSGYENYKAVRHKSNESAAMEEDSNPGIPTVMSLKVQKNRSKR